MAGGYAYLWEFIVKPDRLEEFQREYGPQGAWVALFRQARGYVESLLLRDAANPRRFLTLDRWESAEAYRVFRSGFSRQYEELDRRCERLTAQESSLGVFDEASA